MKKLVWFACLLFVLTACEKEKKTPMIDVQLQQNDSLQKMLDQKNNETPSTRYRRDSASSARPRAV